MEMIAIARNASADTSATSRSFLESGRPAHQSNTKERAHTMNILSLYLSQHSHRALAVVHDSHKRTNEQDVDVLARTTHGLIRDHSHNQQTMHVDRKDKGES